MSGDVTTDRYELAKRVIKVVENDLAAGAYELVDVRVFTGGGRYQVRIYLDREGGINLDQCVTAARSVNILLEEADLFPGRYVIEVSSPGIRRPLRTPAHFAGAVGRKIAVKALDEGRLRKISGVLQASDESGIVVAPHPGRATPDSEQAGPIPTEESTEESTEEPATVRLAYKDIREADLDPAFDAQALIGEDRRRRKEAKRQERQERRKKPRGRPRKGRPES